MIIPGTLQKAIDELSKLPSIGRKSAQRLALHILKSELLEVQNLSKSILDLKENTQICKNCFNISENEICEICNSEKRDKSIITGYSITVKNDAKIIYSTLPGFENLFDIIFWVGGVVL